MVGARSPVVALAATTTAGYGVLFYAYGVLLVPMHDDLGWSRTFLSGAFSLALMVGALLTVPVGRWLDHHPPRGLFLLGSAAATVLVVSWGLAHDRVVFAATWMLLGACQAVLFYDPAFTVLTKWFRGRARNRAITTVTLVAGFATTVFSPLTAALDGALGWRGAVVVLAAILGGVTIPCFAVGLRPPTDGPTDDATGATMAVAHEDPGASTTPSEAFRSRGFRLLTISYLLSSITTFAVAVHLVAYLLGQGLGAGTAATALGAIGLVQVLGRGTFIRLSAHRPAVHLATWVLAAKAGGLLLLLVVPDPLGLMLFVFIYGAANGMATLTRATTLAELYGPAHYGSISAVIASICAIGGALAPFAAAVAIDLVGSETPVFAALAAVTAMAAVANELVARPTRQAGATPLELDPAAAAPEA